jgi:hypothetical protein
VQASLKELNRSSLLISFWIPERVVGWTRRKAISQMTLWALIAPSPGVAADWEKHHQRK